jgi:NAD(P)-dependent dehydrogenase (short-subunit alcohol dehydrogenase family)
MNNSAILSGKRAAVFGAGGSISAAVAKEFAAEGAEVFSAAGRMRTWTTWRSAVHRRRRPGAAALPWPATMPPIFSRHALIASGRSGPATLKASERR